ncbi:MAG: hypothetical protein ABEJ40_05005, partial [Haloarculaceae archaeon]
MVDAVDLGRPQQPLRDGALRGGLVVGTRFDQPVAGEVVFDPARERVRVLGGGRSQFVAPRVGPVPADGAEQFTRRLPCTSETFTPSWASVASTCERNFGAIDSVGSRSKWFSKFLAHVTPLRWVQASDDGLTTPEDSDLSHVSVDAPGLPASFESTGFSVKCGSPSVNGATFRFGFATGGESTSAACVIPRIRRWNVSRCCSLCGNRTPFPLIATLVLMLYSEYQYASNEAAWKP